MRKDPESYFFDSPTNAESSFTESILAPGFCLQKERCCKIVKSEKKSGSEGANVYGLPVLGCRILKWADLGFC